MAAGPAEVEALNRVAALGGVACADPCAGAYEGYVSVGARAFAVAVVFPPGDGAEGGEARRSFACERDLAALLAGHERVLRHRLGRAPNVLAFLVELRDVAERVARAEPGAELPGRAYYSRVMAEMEAAGWDRLEGIDAAMRVLRLRHVDARGRAHSLEVELPPDYPRRAPRCVADLPAPFRLRWEDAADRSLASVAAQHAEAVARFQDAWDVLDELDARCWVLEPSGPSRAATSRRVAVARHASLHVEVDALRPRAVCECRFLGAEAVVGPMRRLLNERLFSWDESATPLANLERVLGITFPAPDTANREEFAVECGICYAYRLDDDGLVPDRVCDNARCSRPFHARCLHEWLSALPSSRKSFGTVFGTCPYCSEPVTVAL